MEKSKVLQELRGRLKTEFDALDILVEAKTATEDQAARFNVLVDELKANKADIAKAEEIEAIRGEKSGRAAIVFGGNTDNEEQLTKRFSMALMIAELAEGRGGKDTDKLTGINKEIASEGNTEASRINLTSHVKGVMIPGFVIGNDAKAHNKYEQRMMENRWNAQRAIHTTSISDTPKAGYVIQTEVRDFIDVFRNNMVLDQLGITMLTNLVGNILMPKKSSGAAGAWLSETGSITLENTVLGSVTATPHRVGAGENYSKTLLLQQGNYSIDNMITEDMAQALARLVQLGLMSGSGSSNQPTGIATALVAASENLVAMGTNGLAPTFAKMIEMETVCANDNADVTDMKYLFNTATRGKLKGTEKTSTSTAQFIWENGNIVNGRPALVSNTMRSNLTKGSSSGICSEAIFGNWKDAGLAQWGGVDLVVDPFTSAGSNTVNVYYNIFVDVFIRRLQSFSYLPDML